MFYKKFQRSAYGPICLQIRYLALPFACGFVIRLTWPYRVSVCRTASILKSGAPHSNFFTFTVDLLPHNFNLHVHPNPLTMQL